jgi:Na+/phosphate symporter
VIACDQALAEVKFMRDSNLKALAKLRLVLSGEGEEKDETRIVRIETDLDGVQHEVTGFLGQMMAKRLPANVAARARRLLRLADELESVSDEAAAILRAKKRLAKDGQDFSDVSRERILSLHDRVATFAVRITALVESPRPPVPLANLQSESKNIHELVRASRQSQLSRIGPDDPMSPARVLVELDVINAYERIRAYYLNIAETLADGK